ncbi:MAG: hydrogenase 4 subunit B [Gammaproteobacteria bacterium HGW-Gammaproteobacteria-3]|nr:MAG: hydrogenase 4 subunit B [Gammaproteobacteria bacterium HGW-Gammaproteobacteria-3]
MILYLAYLSLLAALLSAGVSLLTDRREYLSCGIKRLRARTAGWLPLSGKTVAWLDRCLEPDFYALLLRHLPFVLLGISGVAAVLVGAVELSGDFSASATLPLGLPWLHWHVRIDALSGFFFCVLGLPLVAVSLFGPGYVREFEDSKAHALAILGFFTGLFVAGMEMVLLADDAFFFMIAWEWMSVASYFLVAYHHEQSASRRASFLYLLMAEIGALCIILGFGVLVAFSGGFTFDALREVQLTPLWASAAFVLALLGFGMKAGLVPIHAWLPEAHPAAPSHISALMSGVMLKIAVYGFLRFIWDLLPEMFWEWGVLVLVTGASSAILGILYALQQQNLKRLLAYSSVENIGIIFTSLGLAIIFFSTGYPQFGALGLLAGLLHCFNHALFKTLLFLGAGCVLHQTHEINLEKMGGLIHRMPKLAALFLVGTLSISALPPLNGFVSEWLTLQAALQATHLESGVLRSLIPTAAAVLALTGALGVACFVKVYGVAFLGLPRSLHIAHAHEVNDMGMLAGPALLALCCVLFGVFPTPLIDGIRGVIEKLTGAVLPNVTALGWLWVTPVDAKMASYSPILVLISLLVAGALCYYLLHRGNYFKPRRAEPWDCGFGGLNARMQYTSGAFSMPVRRIFNPVYKISETLDAQTEDPEHWRVTALKYQFQVEDKSWYALYQPTGQAVTHLARRLGRIQTGSIRTYLGYSFVTLIFLLWVIS